MMHGMLNIKLKDCQNIVYIKIRCINLSVKVTDKRSHIAKGLVEDLVKNI
jgi:hypothetical protein